MACKNKVQKTIILNFWYLIWFFFKKIHKKIIIHVYNSLLIFGGSQLGPQQLKYMTALKDSSDFFAFSSLTLLEAMAEEEEESFLAWEKDLRLFLACWWSDLIV